MGVLVPEDFPLAKLANEEERRVVEAFCDRLTDGWLVIPDVGLSANRDHQIDVVIAHETDGAAVVEVKGHRPQIRAGLWYAHGAPMQPQPISQAKSNSYALRERLRAASPELAHLDVEYGVVFPNLVDVEGDLPPDVHPSQVISSRALEDPQSAVDALLSFRYRSYRLGPEGLATLVATLCPNTTLVWDPEARSRHARRRLDEISRDQTRALETLDLNRRVCVTGGSGTGKTRLAMAWARRAAQRGERVLVTCFNEPLADVMSERMADLGVTVGCFHQIARFIDGMPPLEVPEDADSDWWDTVMAGHLQSNWHRVTERFDTIIVDEAQDLSLTWLTMLEQLLAEHGPRRLMILADTNQTIYERGFRVPGNEDGWTRCELSENCRNTSQIAALLRRHLGGDPSAVGGPESESVRFVAVEDDDAAAGEVGEAIDVIMDEQDHYPDSILVCTTSTALRNQLIDDYAFVRWEDRGPDRIVCETIHRVKGLEFDHVIIATSDQSISDELLYVGVGRAIMSLTVLAPEPVIADLLAASRPAP